VQVGTEGLALLEAKNNIEVPLIRPAAIFSHRIWAKGVFRWLEKTETHSFSRADAGPKFTRMAATLAGERRGTSTEQEKNSQRERL
jgi:hypothetical protein